jgi:hypothetical protein
MNLAIGRPARSDELRVMFRPMATYAELSAQRELPLSWLVALRRPLLLLVVLGGFVSLTSAGRFTLPDLASTIVAWSFAPVVQTLALTVALALSRSLPSPSVRPRALDLYFAGQGPWLLFLCVFATGAILLPDPGPAFSTLLRLGVVPLYLLLTILWGGITTWAFFRHGLGLARARAAGATAIFYAIFVGSIAGYYLSVYELQPLVSPP